MVTEKQVTEVLELTSGYGERTLYRKWTYLVLFAIAVVVVVGEALRRQGTEKCGNESQREGTTTVEVTTEQQVARKRRRKEEGGGNHG